jgi:hypothetical protein
MKEDKRQRELPLLVLFHPSSLIPHPFNEFPGVNHFWYNSGQPNDEESSSRARYSR